MNEEGQLNTEGWLWTPANNSVGVLKVRHDHNKNVEILWNSAVIAELTSPEGSVKLFPNPAKSSVKISCSFSIEQPIKIELVDLTGRVEDSAQISAATNNAAFELNLSGLQPGSYFVQITNAQRRFVKKLVVVK